jgi:hypothetical protein
MMAAGGPKREPSRRSKTFDHGGMRCFLKDNEIGRDTFDHIRQRLLETHSTKSDVVTE